MFHPHASVPAIRLAVSGGACQYRARVAVGSCLRSVATSEAGMIRPSEPWTTERHSLPFRSVRNGLVRFPDRMGSCQRRNHNV